MQNKGAGRGDRTKNQKKTRIMKRKREELGQEAKQSGVYKDAQV